MRRTFALGVASAALAGIASLTAHASTQGSPASLSGRVSDGTVPVRHARVVVRSSGGSSPAVSTSTDADGRFAFTTLAAGTYHIRAEKPGFLADARTVSLAGARATTLALRLPRGAAVEGRLIDPRSPARAPIAVQAIAVDRLLSGPDDRANTELHSASTDERGHFRMHTLPEGQYLLRVVLGEVSWYFPGTTRREDASVLSLSSGETFDARDFETSADPDGPVIPQAPSTDAEGSGSVEGRVLDEFGDPAPWVMVQLLERRFLADRFRLLPVGWGASISNAQRSTRTTDDLGRFHFGGLAARDYYLSALPEPFGRDEHGPETDELSGLAPAFFPGHALGAEPVRIGDSDAVHDLTITLTSARTGAVSGTVLTAEGQPEPPSELTSYVRLSLAPGGDVQPALSAQGNIKGGAFAFRNLPAGEYLLQIMGGTPVSLIVAPDTTSEITVMRRPAINLRGRVLFEGDAVRPLPADVNVGVEPTDAMARVMFAGRGPQRVDPDWTFWNMTGSPGVIRARTSPEWALRSVMLNGRDVTDARLEFAADVAGIDVVLTSQLGAVSGTVMEGEAPSATHGVVIFGDDRALLAYPSRFLHIAHVDARGRFVAPGLLPGPYLALPLPDNRQDGVELEWLDTMRPFAVPLTVSEGNTTNIRLQIR